jgi:GT2 family glycosyltransferase
MTTADPVPSGEDSIESVDVAVVIATLGRPQLLEQCLRSLEACRPRAREIVVVDQSRGTEVTDVVSRFAHIGARVIAMAERGLGLARNRGLAAVNQAIVAITDDDCVVDRSWIGTADRLAEQHPRAIATGRVLPGEGEGHVPSTRTDEEPHDFTGELHAGALFGNNSVVPRSELLAFGGFDELIPPIAEDNDLGYRWLAAGHAMRYEPDLVIWHCDWRTPAELRELYWHYGRLQGVFYAKHLRARDLRVLRFLRADVGYLLKTVWRRLRRRPTAPVTSALIPVLGLPHGLWQGRARHPATPELP